MNRVASSTGILVAQPESGFTSTVIGAVQKSNVIASVAKQSRNSVHEIRRLLRRFAPRNDIFGLFRQPRSICGLSVVLLAVIFAPVLLAQTNFYFTHHVGLTNFYSRDFVNQNTPLNLNDGILALKEDADFANGTLINRLDIKGRLGHQAWGHIYYNVQNLLKSNFHDRSTFDLSVNELYMQLSLSDFLEIGFGREKPQWGYSKAWNVTGVANASKNSRDIFNVVRPQAGVDMIRGDLYLGKYSLHQILAFGRDYDISIWKHAIKFYGIYKGYEIEIIGSYSNHYPSNFGLNITRTFFDNIKMYAETLYSMGSENRSIEQQSPVTKLPDGRLMPPQYRIVDANNPSNKLFSRYLLGLEYNFQGGNMLIVEYYHNSANVSSRHWQEFVSWIHENNSLIENPDVVTSNNGTNLAMNNLLLFNGYFGNVIDFRQNYLFFHYRYLSFMGKKFLNDLTLFVSLDDGSILFKPTLTLSIHQPLVKFYLDVLLFAGRQNAIFTMERISKSFGVGLLFEF